MGVKLVSDHLSTGVLLIEECRFIYLIKLLRSLVFVRLKSLCLVLCGLQFRDRLGLKHRVFFQLVVIRVQIQLSIALS
jgi:hypothetical protein